MPNSSAILRCRSLTLSYGPRTLFAGVDLEIGSRERVALLGASGSGKSTLLHCLSGVAAADSGDVWLRGQLLAGLDREGLAALRRSAIGTVFQFFHLLPTLTAAENIELPLQLLGQPLAARRARVGVLLQRMGLESRAGAFPARLSGGEMQRVAIARAIAHQPAIVFADEPTGNLDQESGQSVLRLLQEITEEEGASLLMVTHSEDAAAICQRQYVLRDRALQPR